MAPFARTTIKNSSQIWEEFSALLTHHRNFYYARPRITRHHIWPKDHRIGTCMSEYMTQISSKRSICRSIRIDNLRNPDISHSIFWSCEIDRKGFSCCDGCDSYTQSCARSILDTKNSLCIRKFHIDTFLFIFCDIHSRDRWCACGRSTPCNHWRRHGGTRIACISTTSRNYSCIRPRSRWDFLWLWKRTRS